MGLQLEEIQHTFLGMLASPAYRLRNPVLKDLVMSVNLALGVEYRMPHPGLARRVLDDARRSIRAFLADEELPASNSPPRHLLEEALNEALDHPVSVDMEGNPTRTYALPGWLEAHPDHYRPA